MTGILGLLNQTVTLATKASYGADGRPAFNSGNDIKVRFEAMAKRVLMPDGTIKMTDAFMMAPSDVTISTDDKVTYSGITYKVIEVFAVPGASGSTEHQEIGLVKWP